MPQIWTLLIFLEKFRKQQLHQVEADSSVQNSLPIPRLPVLLREIDASSRNLAQRVAHPEVVRGRQDFYSIVLGLGKLLAAKNFFANEGILLMRLPR